MRPRLVAPRRGMRITERERQVPADPPPLPQSLVHQLLSAEGRVRDTMREQARARAAEDRERYERLAADIAGALHELRGFLDATATSTAAATTVTTDRDPDPDDRHGTLTAVARRFASALEHAGVHLEDPLGSAYPDVAARVDVRYAPPSSEVSDLVVGRTLRPGVRLHDGTWVRRAQVLLEDRRPGRGEADAEADRKARSEADGEGTDP